MSRKVGVYFKSQTTNLQERLEPVHLSEVQTGDDRKGDRHGELPQVGLHLLLFTFYFTNFLCGQEHAVVSSSHQSKPLGKYDFAVNENSLNE